MTENTDGERRQTFEQRVDSSSYVQRVAYLPDKRVLEVIFKSKPDTLYAYADFPPEKWVDLQTAESIGSYVAKVVVGPTGKNRPPLPPFTFTKRAV